MRRGFTLLEVMLATLIMAIAVTGLLSNLTTSLRNAARLTDHDRAALLARRKMDELLIAPRLPAPAEFGGPWENAPGGWRARVTPFESQPGAGPGSAVLERVELEVWWMSGENRRTFTIDAYRRGVLGP